MIKYTDLFKLQLDNDYNIAMAFLGCFMPTSLYFTAHQPAKQARLTRSSIHSIPLALDIEDGCRHTLKTFK